MTLASLTKVGVSGGYVTTIFCEVQTTR